jgi:hypothetical protein
MVQYVINMPQVKQNKLSVKRILHFMFKTTLESGAIFKVNSVIDTDSQKVILKTPKQLIVQ